ncbi:hypothetical protein HYR99_23680 [Candidatus Poribacteria bacterium]|nr:hypothetical protein [Candidatus Poribacteria bacterium]
MSKDQAVVKPEDLQKFIALKPWIRKELGVYKEACEAFARRVSQLDGVLAIGAIPYHGYVDLWTVTDRKDRDLDTAIIEYFGEVVRKSDLNLLFDFMITSKREHLPEEAIVLYEKEE